MKKILTIIILILSFSIPAQSNEWKNKNKWKISCGVVDKESLIVNGKSKRYSKNEFKLDLNKAKYFAGHSLGEYSALSCAGYLNFSDTLKILRVRGDAMQNSVPKGQGGMVAVLGSKVEIIEKILTDNKKYCLLYTSPSPRD